MYIQILPIKSTSYERNFSKLKLIKSYFISIIQQIGLLVVVTKIINFNIPNILIG